MNTAKTNTNAANSAALINPQLTERVMREYFAHKQYEAQLNNCNLSLRALFMDYTAYLTQPVFNLRFNTMSLAECAGRTHALANSNNVVLAEPHWFSISAATAHRTYANRFVLSVQTQQQLARVLAAAGFSTTFTVHVQVDKSGIARILHPNLQPDRTCTIAHRKQHVSELAQQMQALFMRAMFQQRPAA